MGTEDKLYNQIKQAAENAEQKDFPGMDKIWARVEEKLETNVAKKETSNWKKIAVAASIVLVATIGYQFYTDSEIIATPKIVNEIKVEELNSKEVLVETAKENQILSEEEVDIVLEKQLQNTKNDVVVTTVKKEKAAVYYPEKINIVNDDEVITYVRTNKSAEVVPAKTEMELLASEKNKNVELTTKGRHNFITNYNQKHTSDTSVKREQIDSSEKKAEQNKKTAPLIVINGKASTEKELLNINSSQLDSIVSLKEPLYIINGIEYSEQELFGPNPTSPYSPLNKQNITKTIILQDAEAVKEYGEKGKNGVVLITTK